MDDCVLPSPAPIHEFIVMLRTDRNGTTVIRSAFAESIDLSFIYITEGQKRETYSHSLICSNRMNCVGSLRNGISHVLYFMCFASLCSSLRVHEPCCWAPLWLQPQKKVPFQSRKWKHSNQVAHLEVGTVTVFWPVQRWWRPWRMWDGCGGAGKELIDRLKVPERAEAR